MVQRYKIVFQDSGDSCQKQKTSVREIFSRDNDYNVSPVKGDENALIVEPRHSDDLKREIDEKIPNGHNDYGHVPYEIEEVGEEISLEELPDSEKEIYERTIDDLKTDKEYLIDRINELNNEIKELKGLEDEKENIIEEARKKQKKLEGLRGKFIQTRDQKNELKQKYQKAEEEFKELEEEYRELEEELEKAKKQLTEKSLETSEKSLTETVNTILETRAEELALLETEKNSDQVIKAYNQSEEEYVIDETGYDRDKVEKLLETSEPVYWTEKDEEEYQEAEKLLEAIEDTNVLSEEDIDKPKQKLLDKKQDLEQKKNKSVDKEAYKEVQESKEEYIGINTAIQESTNQIDSLDIGLIENNSEHTVKIPGNNQLIADIIQFELTETISEETTVRYEQEGDTREIKFNNITDRTKIERGIKQTLSQKPLNNLDAELAVSIKLGNNGEQPIQLRNDKTSFEIEHFLREIKSNDKLQDNLHRDISTETGKKGYQNPVKGTVEAYDQIYDDIDELGLKESEILRQTVRGVKEQ